MPPTTTPVGRQMIANLKAAIEGLRTGGGKTVTYKATARGWVKVAPPTLLGAEVAAIRAALGVSQPVFAGLIGASPAAVRAWEQGAKPVRGVAAVLLAHIRDDPAPWRDKVTRAVGGG
jgi:putative transcriptional regulator